VSLAALQIAVRLRGVLERVPLANGDVDATPGASNNSCARHENSSYVRLKLVRSGRARYTDPAALRRRGSTGGTGPLAATKSMRRTPPAPACTGTVSPGLTPVPSALINTSPGPAMGHPFRCRSEHPDHLVRGPRSRARRPLHFAASQACSSPGSGSTLPPSMAK